MLIDKKINIKLRKNQVEYYSSLGYIIKDNYVTIKTSDLNIGSNQVVNVIIK